MNKCSSLTEWLNTQLHINKTNKETTIKTILKNNNYPQIILQQKQKPPKKNNEHRKEMGYFHIIGIIDEQF
jgi:hypothetical protein